MQERYADGHFPTRRSLHAASSTPDTTAHTTHASQQADTNTPAVTTPQVSAARPTADECPKRPRNGKRNVGRASLLAGLLAMTVVVPLTGFVGPDSSVALPTRAFGTPMGSTTWATGQQETSASTLEGSLAAASRARVRAPLEVSQCISVDTAANGTRVVTESAALVWPMKQGTFTLSSPFGMRVSPISGQLMMHEGIDMSGSLNTPIYAVADGVIVEVSENSHSGTYVKAKHEMADGTVFYSAYLHEYPDQILVEEGQEVKAGERIGGVGSNGWSTGPHLHFEIHDSTDTPVDPHQWLDDEGAAFIGQECQ